MFLYAFDLIELNGDDLRRDPLEVRKATFVSVLSKAAVGLRLNEHIEHDEARWCSATLASSGSKGSYPSALALPLGRSRDWLKCTRRP